MTHHVQFPPYLPRDKIDGEPHPVDVAERPVLGQTVPGIEHHVLAVVQRILRQTLPWNGNASQPNYSLLSTGPPPRSVFDVIRRGGRAMSELGQSRHFDRAPPTSGLARLADILRVIRHVSKVPEAAIEPDLRLALAKPRFRRLRST
jgi:hypothetical protein